MTPRWARWALGTGAGVLTRDAVEVAAEPGQFDSGSAPEHGNSGIGRHEPASSKGSQLADRHTIPGDDECLAMIQRPHDRAALVPKLPLSDISYHGLIAALRATGEVMVL